ncbi:MAG: P-II family nitrogen regulator [Blastocatellia bacterium]|nr:P-II family nitrogen regulator [Blastocatellia bacterium]
MKIVMAVIQPFMLSKVTRALEEIPGFPGMTVMDVRGFGRERGANASHKIIEDFVEYVQKVRIEVVAADEVAEEIARVIVQAAHTGNRGDGKVFIWPVEFAARIKTGEQGEAAVSGELPLSQK